MMTYHIYLDVGHVFWFYWL